MTSKAEQLYQEHHVEFEKWFTFIHPNHDLTFEWEYVYDTGWYKEGMANGAWITWLDLTCKHTNGRSNDTVDSLSQETQWFNDTQLALTTRTKAILIPLADQLLNDGKLEELKSLVAIFPSCSARMTLAGKIANAENS
jgi:hypothetical protein